MVDVCMNRGVFRVSVCGQTEIEQLSRDGSHYSLSTGILPSLGARSNRRVKLRNFIISPYDRHYRWANLSRCFPSLSSQLFLGFCFFMYCVFNACRGWPQSFVWFFVLLFRAFEKNDGIESCDDSLLVTPCS